MLLYRCPGKLEIIAAAAAIVNRFPPSTITSAHP